jgi:glycosyltransferase involved in cell wall biosynthesis
MPLKVLMICPEFIPKMGGAEIQAFSLSKALTKKGLDVRVLTRLSEKSWKKQEALEGIPVQRVDYPRIRLIGGGLLNTFLAWNILTRYKDFDLFHFHIGGSHMVLPLLILKLLNKPSILKISGWWELERSLLNPNGQIPRLMRMLLFRSDAIISLSDEIKTQLLTFGFPADRIISLPNGVDTQRFYPAVDKTASRKIIFVGRLVTEKGVPVLLRAAGKLTAEFPDISVDLVGAGPIEEELKQMIGNLGLYGKVRFLGRLDNVANVLKTADIYVQPSLNEGLPNSLLEAMASGLPVVVTNVGGMPDVVTDGVEGFVVEPSNIDALAVALERLLHDSELRKKMGARCREKIQQDYSLDSVTDNYIALYKRLMDRN